MRRAPTRSIRHQHGRGHPLRLVQLLDKSSNEPSDHRASPSTQWKPRIVRYFVEQTLEAHEQLFRLCRLIAQRSTDFSDRLTLRGSELLGVFAGAQRIL